MRETGWPDSVPPLVSVSESTKTGPKTGGDGRGQEDGRGQANCDKDGGTGGDRRIVTKTGQAN